jgi:hypothetical protein
MSKIEKGELPQENLDIAKENFITKMVEDQGAILTNYLQLVGKTVWKGAFMVAKHIQKGKKK